MILNVTEDAKQKASSFNNIRLVLGHQVQYTFDNYLISKNIPFLQGYDYSLFDRIIDNDIFDDKVATFLTANGSVGNRLSPTHTISYQEYEFWNELQKQNISVYIESFSYCDNTHMSFQYNGRIKYSNILSNNHLIHGRNSFYFIINNALKYKEHNNLIGT